MAIENPKLINFHKKPKQANKFGKVNKPVWKNNKNQEFEKSCSIFDFGVQVGPVSFMGSISPLNSNFNQLL